MAEVEVHGPETGGPTRQERRTREVAAGGSVAEAVLGLGAIVLSILGLTRYYPADFAAVATIIVSLALLLESGSIAARMLAVQRSRGEIDEDVSAGMSAETLAGIAGLTLGILALFRIDALVVLPCAAMVLGAGMLFGSAATSRVNSYAISGAAEPTGRKGFAIRETLFAASAAHVFVGLAAIVLGIIGLLSTSPIDLTLVAMLSLGATVVLSGAAIGGRLMTALRH